jgi:hypothetical protein
MPVTTGLLVGLGWGLLLALLDGLPLLLQGSPWPHLGSRLLALAYLSLIYGALGILTGGVLGVVALLGLRLIRRRASRAALAGGYAGVLTAVATAIFGSHRFQPVLLSWGMLFFLGILAGALAGRLLYQAARGRGALWPVFRTGVLVTYGAVIIVVLAVSGFRLFLRDLPLFNPPATNQVATAERPNIVLITASGIRPDHLGINGYDHEISPNVDALAWRGTRFNQAIAPASWTEPSLASLLTSLYPSELGITCRATISCQPHLDPERLTLAEALQDAGYRTQAFLTDPWLTAELGFDQGFGGFESVRAEEPFDVQAMRARVLGGLLGCQRNATLCELMTQGHGFLFDSPIPPGWGDSHILPRVARFVEIHGDERFFLWVHFAEAVPPYDPGAPFGTVREGDMANPVDLLERIGYWELGDPFTPREKLLPLDLETLTALYDGEIHQMDRLVGELNVLFDQAGLIDRTLVVFTSDHGQEFMEHGGYTYGHSLHDEVVHVPLIIAGPGVVFPADVDTTVGLLDVAPTLAEIAGAFLPPAIERRSLVPALRGETLKERPVFSESLYRVPQESKGMYRDGYKVIYHVDKDQFELYDLKADPDEQHDLATQVVPEGESLKRDLLQWMARTSQVARELPRAAPPREFKNAVW